MRTQLPMEFKQPLANNSDWAEVKTNTVAVLIAVDMQHNSVLENEFKNILKESEPFNITLLPVFQQEGYTCPSVANPSSLTSTVIHKFGCMMEYQ